MSIIIQSNSLYTGSKQLPHIVDFITTTSARFEFLQKSLNKTGGDSNYITLANADSMFLKLLAHKERVATDGGVVLSLDSVLKALVFVARNNLSASDYLALSAGFGVKFVDGSTKKVQKVYGINAISDLVLITDFDLVVSADGTNSLTNPVESSVLSYSVVSTPLIVSDNFIIGGSMTADLTAAAGTVSAPIIYRALSTAGKHYANNLHNSTNPKSYTTNSAGGYTTLELPKSSTVGYETRSLVNFSSSSANEIELYVKGKLATRREGTSVDLSTGKEAFMGISSSSATVLFNESWFVSPASKTLAANLSNYLA